MQLDGTIDLGQHQVTALHVMRREPAADIAGLKIRVEAMGEVPVTLIPFGVTYKAGVILEWPVRDRRQKSDQIVWKTATSKERYRQMRRFQQGSVIKCAVPLMDTCIKTIHIIQVRIDEECF